MTDVPDAPPAPASRPGRWLVLVGLRASGKSTVARRLAARRGLAAIDLDDRVRARFGGRTVTRIWAEEGEPAFRAAEAVCLASVLEEPPGVLALGGGTPTVPAAAEQLRAAAAAGAADLVYLRASPERLADRLATDRGDRPALGPSAHEPGGGGRPEARGGGADADADSLAAIRRETRWAFETRDELYRALASVVVDLDELEASIGGGPASAPAAVDRVVAVIEARLAELG